MSEPTTIDHFLERLYADGCKNDAVASERASMMLNITPSTGQFLDLLIRESGAKRILELGTSNGYSTCWLARAASTVGATVDTIDSSAKKSEAALANLARCELDQHVSLHTVDCGEFLRECDENQYDFVFLDSDRSAYIRWASDLIRATRFGLLVVDNAVSHAQELLDLHRSLIDDHGMSVVVVPIGKGQMLVQPRL